MILKNNTLFLYLNKITRSINITDLKITNLQIKICYQVIQENCALNLTLNYKGTSFLNGTY